MHYYALWVNRNGQHLWDGPYSSHGGAHTFLASVIDKSGGTVITSSSLPLSPARQAGTWKVEGTDGLDDDAEYYPLSEHPTPQQAMTAARERLAELNRTQAGAGGQSGIQDRVYVVHPDGRRERIFGDGVPW